MASSGPAWLSSLVADSRAQGYAIKHWKHPDFTGFRPRWHMEVNARAFTLAGAAYRASNRRRRRSHDRGSLVCDDAASRCHADVSLPAMLLAFVVITVVHELIHAVVHPMAGRSSHTVLGFWPSRILFYAHYDGELSRNRFVAILLMPLFVISIVPLVVAALVGASSGWVAFASSFNALMACVDILGAGLLLFQIPATAIVRNQGWKTYWREHEKLAAQPIE